MACSTDISLHKTGIFILKHCKENIVVIARIKCVWGWGGRYNFIFPNGLLCHFALIVNILGELSFLSDAAMTEYNPQTVSQTCAWIAAPVDIAFLSHSAGLLPPKKEAS